MYQTWERRDAYRGLVWRPEGNNQLVDVGVDGMVILKCIFKKCDGVTSTGFFWFRIGTGGGRM